MYRIKHKPTGLYYQPHKHRGNTLSLRGKIYHQKHDVKMCSIHLGNGWKKPNIGKYIEKWLGKDWDELSEIYKCKCSHGIIIPSSVSDWEHEEVV